MTTPPAEAATPSPPSSVITVTPTGEYHAPWLVYCDTALRFRREPRVSEVVLVGVTCLALLGIAYMLALDDVWAGVFIFLGITITIAVVALNRMVSNHSHMNTCVRTAETMPAKSIRECAMQCVVLASARKGGGNFGLWFIDPRIWRDRCRDFLAEEQPPPTVVSVDVEIAADLLSVGDVYEEADVGTGRQLTPRAKRSLQWILVGYAAILLLMLSLNYTWGRSGAPHSFWFWWMVGHTVYILARINGVGNGLTSAIASPRKLSLMRLGKETVFTPNDSVLVVQMHGHRSGIRAYTEHYDGAKKKVTVIACRDDGEIAKLTFDDRRDAGLADLLARWNAPARADELPAAVQSRRLRSAGES